MELRNMMNKQKWPAQLLVWPALKEHDAGGATVADVTAIDNQTS